MRGKKTAWLGFLLALSMILSYIESILPFSVGIPGIKLGLPNLIVVLLLYRYGGREAFLVNCLRILLTGFLFGNLYSIFYALSGAVCSFFTMQLLRKTGFFSIIGVSICGGVFHNIGQILIAVVIVETAAPAFYLPALLTAGVLTGFLIGLTAKRLLQHIN